MTVSGHSTYNAELAHQQYKFLPQTTSYRRLDGNDSRFTSTESLSYLSAAKYTY